MKHIIIMAAFMCVLLFGSLFFGEKFILEPESKYQYGREGCCVFPGRKEDWNGDALYSTIRDEEN